MKKLFAAAAAASILTMSAGPALADTYQAFVTRVSGSWLLTWHGAAPACNGLSLNVAASKPTIAIIDGVEVTLYPSVTSASSIEHYIIYSPSPDGNLTSVKIDGQASIQCDTHTFLLPNDPTPPAPVPTMTEWAMILFGTILAGGAALYIHRRRVEAV